MFRHTRIVGCLILAAASVVLGQTDQLKIPRNTDDCVFPATAANAVNMYPNSNYYIQGTTVSKPGDGSTLVWPGPAPQSRIAATSG